MTEKERITENLIKLLNETYVYNEQDECYQDNETGNCIAIVYPGDSEPFLNGWRDWDTIDGPKVKDKNNLTEDELWSVGWVAYVQNIKDGSFKSFDDLDIKCLNDDETKEYKLPTIPDNIKQKFLNTVNKYIRNNNKTNN